MLIVTAPDDLVASEISSGVRDDDWFAIVLYNLTFSLALFSYSSGLISLDQKSVNL